MPPNPAIVATRELPAAAQLVVAPDQHDFVFLTSPSPTGRRRWGCRRCRGVLQIMTMPGSSYILTGAVLLRRCPGPAE